MKKRIMLVALVAAVFGLVACSAQDKPEVQKASDTPAKVVKKMKTKKSKGKLGVEKMEKDTAK